jgi:hypothetical protein
MSHSNVAHPFFMYRLIYLPSGKRQKKGKNTEGPPFKRMLIFLTKLKTKNVISPQSPERAMYVSVG